MKKYLIGLALLLLAFSPVRMHSEGKKEQQILPGDAARKAMLRERIQKIREQVKHNELITPTQAQDALVTYIATQFELLFNTLAERVADVVLNTLKDESAARAITKLPGALADGIILSYYLISQTIGTENVRKKYLGHLVKVRDAAKCLFAKDDAARAALRNTKGGAICANMPGQKEALMEVLANLGPFIKPVAATMMLGVKTPDGKKIEGAAVQATNIIAPSLTPDVKIITELVETIINLAEQSKTALEKPAI